METGYQAGSGGAGGAGPMAAGRKAADGADSDAGEGGGPALDLDATLAKLQRWGEEIDSHWGDWIEESELLFDMVANHQYTDEEESDLRADNKIPVAFNRMGPIIDAVCGAEILGRQEVHYYPRTLGDTAINEIITRGAEWIRDRCDAPAEESSAARDTFICGLGYTETSFDFESDPDGKPKIVIESGEALKCLPDPKARKPNARDKRFLRYRDVMSREEFVEEFGEDADGAGDDEPASSSDSNGDPRKAYKHGRRGKSDGDVTVDTFQWYELEEVVRTPAPDGSRVVEFHKADFDELNQASIETGRGPLRGVKRKRRCYYEAVITGSRWLKEPVKLPYNKFRFCFMTGKRDRNRGVWYGLARPMKDPQKWANNFFSMVLHIIRTNAKGGLVMEEGAIAGASDNPDGDRKKFEQSWSRSDEITWVGDGALSGPGGTRIKPKEPPQIPAAFANLFDQSVTAIRDTSGVSQEMMGLVDRQQPGILEHQRKQAGYGILAAFFDSFRSYRQENGELLLPMMADLPRGTLVRVVGEDGNPQYVPMIMDRDVADYDVIVSDAPAGPNQKDKNWTLFMQMLPMVKEMMTPEIWIEMLRYSPFPDAFVAKIREVLTKGSQDEKQQMMDRLQLQFTIMEGQSKQLDMQKTASEARVNDATAAEKNMKTRAIAMSPPDPAPQVVM